MYTTFPRQHVNTKQRPDVLSTSSTYVKQQRNDLVELNTPQRHLLRVAMPLRKNSVSVARMRLCADCPTLSRSC